MGWHLDHDLDTLLNLVWIYPETFMPLRLVQAKIEVLVEAQFSSDKLCHGWLAGWLAGRGILKLGIAQA